MKSTDLCKLNIQPYPYQIKGIEEGMRMKRFINGDECGLGKTLMALATIAISGATPALVICPSSLKINWQREVEKFTKLKALVLTDSVKSTFPYLVKMKMFDVVITNYESLRKYFVLDAPKSFTLKDVVFQPSIKIFKSVILDESHRCFPYNTLISTNVGYISIGDIVENRLCDILIYSYDFSQKKITENKIKNYWRNDIGTRKIYRIKTNDGEVYATEGHKIYTDAGRFKEIQEIRSGESVLVLRKKVYDKKGWQDNFKILFQKLCSKSCKRETGSKRKIAQCCHISFKTSIKKNLFVLWKRILCTFAWEDRPENTFLFSELFGKMENETTGCIKVIQDYRVPGKCTTDGEGGNEKSRFKESVFGKDEREKSYVQGGNKIKDDTKIERKAICTQRRKWKFYEAANATFGIIGINKGLLRISCKNFFNKKYIRENSQFIQSGYRDSVEENCDRSGRYFTQIKKDKRKRRKENESVEFVRVESVEVYQPTDRYEPEDHIGRNKYVYDLEIEGTHNYFANNVLVHNCKDAGAQQSKFTRGICKDKEWVIMLTGTPVVNSPSDLATQIAIMGRLTEFGGMSYFKTRYSGPESNLEELNTKIHELCYFRREKKEVFKDMPKLTRSTVYVEFDKCVREEYETCLNDLRQYLAEYRGLTDPEIKKRMRMKALVKFMNLRHISSMGKVMPVISMVRDMNTNVVIFCSHHDIVDQLLLAFPNAVTVTGRDSQNEKQAAVDAFQSREADIIICSIKAAGVGLTLTASSHEIFVEIPWTYADLTQCESREDRIGQTEGVNSYITLGKDSIDDRLFQIIMDKRSIASRITGSDDDIPSDERYFEELMSCINESNS